MPRVISSTGSQTENGPRHLNRHHRIWNHAQDRARKAPMGSRLTSAIRSLSRLPALDPVHPIGNSLEASRAARDDKQIFCCSGRDDKQIFCCFGRDDNRFTFQASGPFLASREQLCAPGLDFQTWDWNVQCGSIAEDRRLGFSNPMSPKHETWGTRASWGDRCGPACRIWSSIFGNGYPLSIRSSNRCVLSYPLPR